MEKKYCVYVHTNKANEKKYVGITSQNPETRWKQGYAFNDHFSRAIQKYGWDGFTHEVLFSGLSKEDACKWEIALISQFDTQNPNNGYNIQSGGNGCAEQNNVSVNQYSLDGKYIKTWSSIKEADIFYGKNNERNGGSQIGIACAGRCKTAYGYMWKFSDGSKTNIDPYENTHHKAVAQYTTDGRLVKIWDTIKEASKALGICDGTITRVCKGNKNRTAGGFVWRYCGDYISVEIEKTKPYKKRILQYMEDGSFVQEFESVSAASRYVKAVSNAHIIECCKEKKKTAYGYIWRYK